jgi:hypothetical protein
VPAALHFANNVLAIEVERRYSIHPKYVDLVHRPARAATRDTVGSRCCRGVRQRSRSARRQKARSMTVHALQVMESKGVTPVQRRRDDRPACPGSP